LIRDIVLIASTMSALDGWIVVIDTAGAAVQATIFAIGCADLVLVPSWLSWSSPTSGTILVSSSSWRTVTGCRFPGNELHGIAPTTGLAGQQCTVLIDEITLGALPEPIKLAS
jgi:hypothetical protein